MGIDGSFILKLNFDNDWFDIENIQKYFVVIVIFALKIGRNIADDIYGVLKWLWILVV